MGCAWGCCASFQLFVLEDDGASIEYFPEELAPIAKEIFDCVKNAIDDRFHSATRGEGLSLMWRKVSMHGHSTVEVAQDLDGPCSDLRSDEIWLVVPAEFLKSDRYFPSLKSKMQLQDEDTLILWRALRMGSRWHVRYAGGAVLVGQSGDAVPFKAEMCERVIPVEDGSAAALAALAAAVVTRYHAMCCAVAPEKDSRVGFNG